MATHDADLSSTDHYRGGLTDYWRKRRKTGRHRRRRRRHGTRSNAGAMVGRSDSTDDTATSLERDDGSESSTFIVSLTQSSIMTTSSPADSATADAEEETVAAHNTTGVDMYFRTAHVLHYASIVILGLFVLQVTQPTTVHLFFMSSSCQGLHRSSCIKHFRPLNVVK